MRQKTLSELRRGLLRSLIALLSLALPILLAMLGRARRDSIASALGADNLLLLAALLLGLTLLSWLFIWLRQNGGAEIRWRQGGDGSAVCRSAPR